VADPAERNAGRSVHRQRQARLRRASVPRSGPGCGGVGKLLTGAQNAREITGYPFRFGFEQAALDQLHASLAPAGKHDHAGAPAAGAHDWKTTTALALRVAREVTGLGAKRPGDQADA
jgi:hypothetical protein